MNDYKELIKELKVEFNECDELIGQKVHFNLSDAPTEKYAILAENCCGEMVGIMQTISCAVDAIEQLVKERDAAVEDLKVNSNCTNCKYFNGEGYCVTNWCYNGGAWEWRGIK